MLASWLQRAVWPQQWPTCLKTQIKWEVALFNPGVHLFEYLMLYSWSLFCMFDLSFLSLGSECWEIDCSTLRQKPCRTERVDPRRRPRLLLRFLHQRLKLWYNLLWISHFRHFIKVELFKNLGYIYFNFRASTSLPLLYNSSLLCHQFLPQFLPPTLALVCDRLLFCPVPPVLPWGLLTPNIRLQLQVFVYWYFTFFSILSWSVTIFLSQVSILTSHSSLNWSPLADLQPSLLQALLCQLLIYQVPLYSPHHQLLVGCLPCPAPVFPRQPSCHPRPYPQA